MVKTVENIISNLKLQIPPSIDWTKTLFWPPSINGYHDDGGEWLLGVAGPSRVLSIKKQKNTSYPSFFLH